MDNYKIMHMMESLQAKILMLNKACLKQKTTHD
jgi:hypothetical protein